MSLLRGVSFDHLKKQTKEFILPGCYVRSDLETVLILQHAGEDNAGWINAYRKEDAAKPLRDRSPREWFHALLPAFAEHVVVGWKNVVGDDCEPAPVSIADIIELMTAYGSDAIDLALRPIYWASHIDNFRDYKPPQVDAEALGKS